MPSLVMAAGTTVLSRSRFPGPGQGGGQASAKLVWLGLSFGLTTPAFAPTTTGYSATVSSGTVALAVTSLTRIQRRRSRLTEWPPRAESASASIPLQFGNNTITIVVSAAGGLTQTYIVSVTRSMSVPDAPVIDSVTAAGGQATISFHAAEQRWRQRDHRLHGEFDSRRADRYGIWESIDRKRNEPECRLYLHRNGCQCNRHRSRIRAIENGSLAVVRGKFIDSAGGRYLSLDAS